MKKILAALLVISLLIGACSKTSTRNAGTWTFKNVTYSPSFANYVLGAFTAYTEINFPSGSLAFTFFDSIDKPHNDSFGINTFLTAYATAPRRGTFGYHLSNQNPPPPGYVYVRMTDTSAFRNYVCVPSSTDSIIVNFDGTSTVVDVAGIQLKSNKDTNDVGTLTAHITQLNYK